MMTTNSLANFSEISPDELMETDGGVIPFFIWAAGYYICTSAGVQAALAGAGLFGIGLGISAIRR